MTDRPPLLRRDTAPSLTHPLTEALSADWPVLLQAQSLIDRLIDQAEAGRRA